MAAATARRKCALLAALAALILCTLCLRGRRPRRVGTSALSSGNATPGDGCACTEPGAGVRHDLCYAPKASERGGRFSCQSVGALRRLGLLQTDGGGGAGALQVSANPPIVSAASADHYAELRQMIRSAQSTLPNASIVVYDLGLGSGQLKELAAFCRVTVRPFDFSAYPPSVRSLHTYRWKPIIMAQSLLEFAHGFWWADSSVRWQSAQLDYVYESAARAGRSSIVLLQATGHSVHAATNPMMRKYVPSDAGELRRVEMHCACLVFAVSSGAAVDALKWLTLCALESDCLSPPHSALHCSFTADRYNDYAHCHRYDQSALNVLLANAFGYNATLYTAGELRFATVERGHVGGEAPKSCFR